LCKKHNIYNKFFGEDLRTQSKVAQYLHEHHDQIRKGSHTYVFNSYFIRIAGKRKDEKFLTEALEYLKKVLSHLETVLSTQKFVSSDRIPTISDMSLACEIAHLTTFAASKIQLENYPNISKWFQNITQTEFRKFKEIHEPLAAIKIFVDGILAGKKVDLPPDPASFPEIGRFNIMLRFKVPAAIRTEFTEMAMELQTKTRKETGCGFFVFGTSSLSDDIILVEEWDSRATWAAHRQAPHFLTIFPKIKSLPEFEILERVEIYPLVGSGSTKSS